MGTFPRWFCLAAKIEEHCTRAALLSLEGLGDGAWGGVWLDYRFRFSSSGVGPEIL